MLSICVEYSKKSKSKSPMTDQNFILNRVLGFFFDLPTFISILSKN